jgi:hypothetical protein
MNRQNKKIIASILFVLISFVCIAQKEGTPPPPIPPPVPPGLPLDGPIMYILIAACLLYGISRKIQLGD